ncbi:FecR family protein [Fulvivirga kasyanovii]|uniref:DUF4974 domain-containing protein n=1 Tax=Fulvivirga kasyanovii TaxID=396812 RepID=A0ABW9RNX5_9BACT|nr:FecR domain-containing protein [Fulvivirga kasyanovii]MTI25838.1 DUF4974 domain-containing protein [Fulvivirga kasyanovii]
MENDRTNIDDELLASYMAGEANADDTAVVEQWIGESEANRRYFEKLKVLWENTGRVAPHQEANVDVDLAWNKFKQRADREITDEPVSKAKGRHLYFYLSRMAAVLVVGFVVYLVYQSLEKSPEANQVELMAKAVTKSDTLPDGSQVALNVNSLVTFNENFSETERSVSLQGEAFFDVVKDDKKPFVIKTKDVIVTVLGTSFYVEAYDSLNTVEVGVEEGVVQVESYGELVLLGAGERISIDKGKQKVSEPDKYNPNDIYWKSETLIFKNEPLAGVFATLEKVYNIKINVENPRILNCRLTGKFYKESPAHIFEIIETNFELTSVEQNAGFTISGDGCE